MVEQIRTSMVDINSNGTTVPGYDCRPSGDGPWPGIVVIQEWWGLEPHIKDIAERFARAGFASLAPDLYHGKVTGEPDEAGKLMMELDQPRAIEEIIAAVKHLKNQSFASGKVGTVGYFLGGGLSIATACSSSDLDGSVIFYGTNPNPIDQLANVRCPVLGLYGGADDGVPVSAAAALSEALEKTGASYDVHIYSGAPHAFFNDTRASYRKEAAEDSWERTLAFFRKNLA